MATTTVTRAGSGAWVKIAFAMFAVGWGANQFSPMLIVYRHELRLGAGAVAGLFLVYALTLIPGLLIGGPASDRFAPLVLPFVVLSPLATLLRQRSVLISAGRALAGLCSGVVFGSATAWVQELSRGTGQSARRAALALTAGFGLGPVVAAVLAQWAPDPLVLPYLPHLAIGVVAAILVWRAPQDALSAARSAGEREPAPDPPENETCRCRRRGTYLAVLADRRAGQPDGVRVGRLGHRGPAGGRHQRTDAVRRFRGPDDRTGLFGRRRGSAVRPAAR